jgi:hypothetical protein
LRGFASNSTKIRSLRINTSLTTETIDVPAFDKIQARKRLKTPEKILETLRSGTISF